jgi:hypothetical protein
MEFPAIKVIREADTLPEFPEMAVSERHSTIFQLPIPCLCRELGKNGMPPCDLGAAWKSFAFSTTDSPKAHFRRAKIS